MLYATFVTIKDLQGPAAELLPEAVSVYFSQAWTGDQLLTAKVDLAQSRDAEITSVGPKNVPTAQSHTGILFLSGALFLSLVCLKKSCIISL